MTTEENALSLYQETVDIQRKWAKKHTLAENANQTDLVRAHNKLVTEVNDTVLSFIRDLAKAQGDQTLALLDLEERVEGGDGTQFTPEDAGLFRDVLSYALEMTQVTLNQLGSASEDPRAKLLTEKLSQIQECLKIVEESELIEEDEEEPSETETEEESETSEPTAE